MTRGNGGIRDRDAVRLEAAAIVEVTWQPAGLEARERRNKRQRHNVRRGYTTVMREDGAGGRRNNKPWA
jgi:hypothetical protein